jgi:hypothetical protein
MAAFEDSKSANSEWLALAKSVYEGIREVFDFCEGSYLSSGLCDVLVGALRDLGSKGTCNTSARLFVITDPMELNGVWGEKEKCAYMTLQSIIEAHTSDVSVPEEGDTSLAQMQVAHSTRR